MDDGRTFTTRANTVLLVPGAIILRVGSLHHRKMDRLVRRPVLDSGRTLRVCDRSLRQLGLRGQFLVLGSASNRRECIHRSFLWVHLSPGIQEESAWIHHQGYVGWLPLAPGEVYYAHRYWYPEFVVVGGVGLAGFGVGINSYRYLNHAVIVNQNNFYNTVNYRRVLVRNVNPTTIAANYRVAPVINDDVIRGYAANSKRFGFGAAGSGLRSEPASVERINHNRSMVSEHGEFKAKDLRD